jgi:hypothetical protein
MRIHYGTNVEAREVDKGLNFEMEGKESGESWEPPTDRSRPRLVSEMGFNNPKNLIILICLVLPRLFRITDDNFGGFLGFLAIGECDVDESFANRCNEIQVQRSRR